MLFRYEDTLERLISYERIAITDLEKIEIGKWFVLLNKITDETFKTLHVSMTTKVLQKLSRLVYFLTFILNMRTVETRI